MSDFLFVYGSLRSNVERTRLPQEAQNAAAYLSANAERFVPATINGLLHAVSWYPALTVDERMPDLVHGEVWRLHDADLALTKLDAYEGGEYHREIRDVRLVEGAILAAWVYVYDAPLGDAPVIDSGDYAHWIAQQTQ